MAVGDFHADGDPDLAAANFNADTVSILLHACLHPARNPCASPPVGTVGLRGSGATYSGTAAGEVIVGTGGNDTLDGGAGLDNCQGQAGTATATACERTATVP